MGWTKFINLELDDDDRLDMAMPIMPQGPEYPPGLRICLCDGELRKLDLEADPDIGDTIDIRAFAKVMSFSNYDGKRRVELQITDLAIEDENQEEPEEEADEEEEFVPSPPTAPEPAVTHEPPPVVKSGQRFGRSYAKARRPFIFHTDEE